MSQYNMHCTAKLRNFFEVHTYVSHFFCKGKYICSIVKIHFSPFLTKTPNYSRSLASKIVKIYEISPLVKTKGRTMGRIIQQPLQMALLQKLLCED